LSARRGRFCKSRERRALGGWIASGATVTVATVDQSGGIFA